MFKKKFKIHNNSVKQYQKTLAAFVANYFSMQKQVYDTCRKERYISPFETIIG